jgi:hypothetical protein
MTVTRHDLLDEATGTVNKRVLWTLTRRRAMDTYGSLGPRYLRAAKAYYEGLVPEMYSAWCMRHGQMIKMVMSTPYGRQHDGVRRSAY